MNSLFQTRLGLRLHVGIFGQSLCGKTNLAKHLMVKYWKKFGVRSIVCDADTGQSWPACALVFRDPEKFWAFVYSQKGCAVFVDDAGGAIKRNDELTPHFTQGRHRFHVLHVMGHYMTNLLPEQRDQLTTLFLFSQGPTAGDKWEEEWADKRMIESVGLPQYEFIWCEKFGDKATRTHRLIHGMFPVFTG
jgi:hypothetical protein